MRKPRIRLDNQGDDGLVVIDTRDAAEAACDQSVAGSRWEVSLGDGYAYAIVSDYVGLAAELEAEGYELDVDAYFDPSLETEA